VDPEPGSNGVHLADACRGDFSATGDSQAAFLVLIHGKEGEPPEQRILLIRENRTFEWFECEDVLGLESMGREGAAGDELLLDKGNRLLLGVRF
jgi:hypothetical protein